MSIIIIFCRVGEGDGEGGEGGDGGEGEGGEGGAKEKQNVEGEGAQGEAAVEGAQGEAAVEGGGGGQVATEGGGQVETAGGGGGGGGGEVNCEATQAYTFNEDDQMDFEPTALVRTTTGMSPYSHVSIPPYLYQYVVYPPSLCFLFSAFMLSCFHTLILSFSHTHTAIPPFQL